MTEEYKNIQLNVRGFALSGAVTFGIAYIACAILVLLSPGFATTLFGWLFHLFNVEKFAEGVRITAGSFIGGFLEVVIYSYLTALILALLYNKFSRRA